MYFSGQLDYLLGKRRFEDGERLGDTFHDLFSCFCVVETKQHGFPDVSPPGSQAAQCFLQLVSLSAERKTVSVLKQPRKNPPLTFTATPHF